MDESTDEEVQRVDEIISAGIAANRRTRDIAYDAISEMRAMDREKAQRHEFREWLGRQPVIWLTEDEVRERYPDSPTGT